MIEYTVEYLQKALNHLSETKSIIRQAIIDKGQTIEEDTFRSYAEKIRAIDTGVDTSDATATAEDILAGKTAYSSEGIKLEGTIKNNGELIYKAKEEQQVIPEGYTTGGIIEPAIFTEMTDYLICLEKTRQILEEVN